VQYQFHGRAANELFGLDPLRNRPDINLWWGDIGIQKNWTGIGATTFYAEVGKVFDGVTGLTATPTGFPGTAGLFINGTSGLFPLGGRGVVVSSDMTWTGGGMVQTIDAAAMDIYLGFRMYWASADFGDFETLNAVQIPGGLENIWYIQGGARIQF
jgi:hypothetical protein